MSQKMTACCVAVGAILVLLATPAQAVFISQDIGGPSLPGSISPLGAQPPGPVAITASGADIWGTADQFHYWFDSWSGNFVATVRFDSNFVGGTNTWRKAGIMARTDTSAGSAFMLLSTTPQQTAIQWRDSAGGGAAWPGTFMPGSPGAASAPYWLMLKRQGTTYTAYWAPDAAGSPGTWSTVNAPTDVHVNPAIPTNALLGIAVTSHDNAQLTTASFSNFTIQPLASPIGRLDPQGSSPNIMGAAYAEVPGGPVVGPVSWELRRYTMQPGVLVEWWIGNSSWSGTPTYSYTSTDAYAALPGDHPISNRGTRGGGAPYYPDQFNTLYGSSPTALDNYSVRWSGEIYIPANMQDGLGQVLFGTNSDDRSYLKIDGNTIFDWGGNNDWGTTPPYTTGAGNPAPLSVGWHTFEYAQQENGGGDDGRLRWYDPIGAQWLDIDAQFLRTMTPAELLASGIGNVGGPAVSDILFNIGNRPGEEFNVRLFVSFQGETWASDLMQYTGVPEPASLLLLGGGLAALARRRRKAARR